VYQAVPFTRQNTVAETSAPDATLDQIGHQIVDLYSRTGNLETRVEKLEIPTKGKQP
jgi:hypothetical protein